MSLTATQTIKSNGDIKYDVSLPAVASSDSLKMTTAQTYLDKNVIVNIHNFDSSSTEYKATDTNKNIILDINITTDDLGNAAQSDVLSGQTFSSENGVALTGTLEPQYYYSGTTVPGATTGNNGDLFFKLTEG